MSIYEAKYGIGRYDMSYYDNLNPAETIEISEQSYTITSSEQSYTITSSEQSYTITSSETERIEET